MKKIIFILFVYLNLSPSLAQDKKQNFVDSILQTVPTLNEKSLIAESYYQLGRYLIHSDTDLSTHYLLLAVQLALEEEDFGLVGKTYNDLSAMYRDLGQYDSALYYASKSLDLSESLNDQLGKAKLFYTISLIFKQKGQYDTALALLKNNLQILGEVRSERGLAVTYNALGQIAEHQGYYVLALDYYYKGLAIYQELGDKSGEAILLNNMGIVNENLEQYDEALNNYNLYYEYNKGVGDKFRMAIGLKNAGSILRKSGQLDSAIFNLKAALELDSLLGSEQSISYDLLGLGTVHLSKDNFKIAFQYFHRSLKLAEDPNVVVPALKGIGSIHMHDNFLDSAVYYLETAAKKAEEMGLNDEMKEAHYLLYELHFELGNIEKAFSHYRNHVEIKDSLFNEHNIQKVANMKAGFEFEQERRKQEIIKNVEIDRAESIRDLFIIGTLLSAIIALLLYIIYRRKKLANEKLNGLYQTVKKQATELKVLDQTKSRFYSNIAHELRTPLTLIGSPLEYILKNQNHNSEVKDYLELMNRNTQHLRALVDDILDLSKLESNKLTSEKEAIEVSFFAKHVFSNFESLAKHLDINYQLVLVSFPKNAIQTDQSKLEKILNNLLSNAFKYTSSDGYVFLRVRNDNKSVFFEVEDSGQGIDAKDLPYIFDRYFQSKQLNVVMQGGSGIGLALSKELTKVIGGELTVKSEKGIGSVFTLSIPYKPMTEPKAFLQIKEDKLEVQESRLMSIADLSDIGALVETRPAILVVEDHPEMQIFIRGLLNPMSNVHLANNGKQALDVLSKENINLIISDIMMPEMDGYELLKIIRQKKSYSHVPFIMLTALTSESHLLRALSIGVDDYLVKPFSPNELIARVKNMMARQKTRKNFIDKAVEADVEGHITDRPERYKLQISEKDRELVVQVEHVLLSHLEDENFSLKELADIFCFSYRQMERNIKDITGLTPKQLQQEVAMQQARKLLEEGKYGNPTAIAYSVGIRHVTRFSNLYEKRFGKRPESYFYS